MRFFNQIYSFLSLMLYIDKKLGYNKKRKIDEII